MKVALAGYPNGPDVEGDRRIKNDCKIFGPKPLSEMAEATDRAGLERQIQA